MRLLDDSENTSSDLPELRYYIRQRRRSLANLLEEGATLELDDDLLRVIPRDDTYIRSLNINRALIGELASELYARKLSVQVAVDGADSPTGQASPPRDSDSAEAVSQPQRTPGADAIRDAIADAEPATLDAEKMKEDRGRSSQATQLVEIGRESAMLFNDGDEGFATFKSTLAETYPIKSAYFRRILARRYFEQNQQAPSRDALSAAIETLTGFALFEGERRQVNVRLAGYGENIYLDLGGENWRLVEITPRGWRPIGHADSPVRFIRRRGMLPLPEPERGGSMDDLRPFLNLATEDDFKLMLAWDVGALRPTGPYPILNLNGEYGSAKSTTAKVQRGLIDPNQASIRALPKEPRDLMISATSGWVQALDNISSVPDWLSDAFCRLSTGGGFATRELYTDGEEVIFNAMRPVIINGIENVVERSDLYDRSVTVVCPYISPERRRDEERFWKDFDAARPRILGALLDAVSCALSNISSVNFYVLPRMADFARWIEAASPALGWTPGEFLAAYGRNIGKANASALEASAAADEVLKLVLPFGGTATQLLALLDRQAEEKVRKRRGWPKSPRALSGALRRIAPNLRVIGITVDFDRDESASKRVRIITISRSPDNLGETPSESSDASYPEKSAEELAAFLDAGSDGRTQAAPLSSEENSGKLTGFGWSDGSDAKSDELSEANEEPEFVDDD
jgi:hypothetical protein